MPGQVVSGAVGRVPENWTDAFGLVGLVGWQELSIVL